MPPIWFDPTPWLTQLWTMLFWGTIGLIGLIVLFAGVIPWLARRGRALSRLLGWHR